MRAIIDILLLGILIICTWSGYKKGLIMGVGGVICIIVSLYGANLLANTFSFDVIPAMKPFASGYMEKLVSGSDGVVERMGWDEYDYSVEDLLEQFPERKLEFCTVCYESIGISDSSASAMAGEAVDYAEANDISVVSATVQILCEKISYAACFILAFLLIIIVLTVIGNLPNLSYKIPNLDLVNDIGGAALGFVTGFLFCAIVVWALKFMGIVIGKDTLAATTLGGWFLRRDILFRYLGI